MWMVPPARSMRVGADETIRFTARNYNGSLSAVQSSPVMSPLALRRHIGQLLIAGFNGTQIPVELRSLAKEFGLGGVILFARNIVEPEQVAEVAFEAARLVTELPVWVSVDQEGGRVARLKAPFTEWPPMATLGRSRDARLAERFARALAAELKAVGITLDYAPVLDVFTNPKNTVIGDRALAQKAHEVARLGAAIIRGLQHDGIAACGKHFPGHGDTVADSHHELPLVEHPPERLREVEFLPFRPAIDAGCDGALICSGDHEAQWAALEALVHAVEDGTLRLARVEDALTRQRHAKERFLASPVAASPPTRQALRAALGRDEHRAIAEEMARFL